MKKKNNDCPCGSGLMFEKCCGQYISEQIVAPTAEVLMRSRYSAYVIKDENYLLNTWHKTTRPETLNLEQDTSTKWIGLDVVRVEQGTIKDDKGQVEFVARYKVNGKAERLHEVSRFRKEQGKWYYLDGDLQ